MMNHSAHSILVTGANGFIGVHLISQLLDCGHSVKGLVRRGWGSAPDKVEVITGDLTSSFEDSGALSSVSTVIHLAARVHQMKGASQVGLDEYRKVNTVATLQLAEKSAKAGVKRFIYLSSLSVNGSYTMPGEFFTEGSIPNPGSPYAISKYEAELGLRKIAQKYSIEIVIIRPPMVYGLGAPGNFSRLVSLIKTRLPLPFGSSNQLRSLIYIENLISFIILCINHPAAANEIFLVSDDDDISLCELICKISFNLSFRPNIFSIPIRFLSKVFIIFKRVDLANQLLKPLRVNIAKARNLLGWTPPINLHTALSLSLKKLNAP